MNKSLKKILIGAVCLAAVVGTYSGNTGGFPPLYTKKSGTSGGICIGGVTEYEPKSKFYGINLALFTINAGEVNGISASIIENAARNRKINGLEIGLVNKPESSEYEPNDLSGLQIGLYNIARSKGYIKRGLGINVGFGGNEKK